MSAYHTLVYSRAVNQESAYRTLVYSCAPIGDWILHQQKGRENCLLGVGMACGRRTNQQHHVWTRGRGANEKILVRFCTSPETNNGSADEKLVRQES